MNWTWFERIAVTALLFTLAVLGQVYPHEAWLQWLLGVTGLYGTHAVKPLIGGGGSAKP